MSAFYFALNVRVQIVFSTSYLERIKIILKILMLKVWFEILNSKDNKMPI